MHLVILQCIEGNSRIFEGVTFQEFQRRDPSNGQNILPESFKVSKLYWWPLKLNRISIHGALLLLEICWAPKSLLKENSIAVLLFESAEIMSISMCTDCSITCRSFCYQFHERCDQIVKNILCSFFFSPPPPPNKFKLSAFMFNGVVRI